MSRGHVEFIQSTDVMQQPWAVGSAKVGLRALSHDPDTGATTALMELPQGWTLSRGHFGAAIEIFVVRGRLTVGRYHLGQHCYSHIPAGVCSGSWQALEPTTLLWMPAATAEFSVTDDHAPKADLADYIPCIDTTALPWGGTITPGFPPGAMRKALRIDAATGASTWLLGVLPQWRETRSEIHPVVEEAFVLLGTMDTPLGTLTTGCYFWRPPYIPHGPFATNTGSLIFFRTDGPLRTDYVWPDIGQYLGAGEDNT